ncbi:hypothetical protein [Vibrio sp. ABG19]|uniref:hypothetical protein n=1 Tax=Vibrio sp. ABG19 TaxID=2817385 RepID=UPI00249DEF14|nr:hypothetical protein [Vibrio sp. ABG19]
MKYSVMLGRAVDKIPFQSYMLRLWNFIRHPQIGLNTYIHHQQREYAFLDIFNGLALLAAIVSLIILYDRSFNEFKIILAFNPLFVVCSWVSNALVFSVVSAISLTMMKFWFGSSVSFKDKVLSLVSKKINKQVEVDFYNLLTHGFRCYAAFGLLLGLPFVKSLGSIYLEGQSSLSEILGSWYWQLYIVVILVGGTAWLFFYPYVKYCKLTRSCIFNTVVVIAIVAASFEPLKWMPFDYTDRFMDKEALCELFKKGDFIKRIPIHLQNDAISKVCTVT